MLAVAATAVLAAAGLSRAQSPDVLQEAVNYVFTGSLTPETPPTITDRKACIVVVPEPQKRRNARYYMGRFKMDISRITTTYSGRQTFYTLEVEGDDIILEYLSPDQKTVLTAFRTADIPLPGKLDLTQRALKAIFTDHCKPDSAKPPF
jgi:hypothetical protein